MNRIPERWWYALSGIIVVATVLVGWQLVASGDDSDDASSSLNDPAPSSSTNSPLATSSTSAEPSEEPTPDRDAWRSKFTDEQLRDFDQALSEWDTYGEQMDEFRSEPPENVEDVRLVLERYTYNPSGLFDSYVFNYVEGGVRIITPPEPLYVTGRKIEVNKKGGLVAFDQCNDYTTLDIRRDDKPVKGAAPTKNDTATIRVQMGYEPGGGGTTAGWRVLTSKVVDKPCE